jgi:hypothetical protein
MRSKAVIHLAAHRSRVAPPGDVTPCVARVIVSAAMAPDEAKLPGASQRDGSAVRRSATQREGRVTARLFFPFRRQAPLAWLCPLAVALSIAAAGASLAQGAPVGSPATKPSDEAAAEAREFSKQIDELKKSLLSLKKRIDDSKSIAAERAGGEAWRKEIEELRALVSGLLGAVADNGEVSQLGASALKNARTKLETLSRDPRFTAEERKTLTDAWAALIDRTEQATRELDKARVKFADLLRMLQNKEDYIAELIAVAQQEEIVKTIRQLTEELNNTSIILNNIIKSLSAPGT